MTLIKGQKHLAQKSQAFKALINWSNNGNQKNPLGSNKFRPSEVFTGPAQALFPVPLASNISRYMEKDIDHLFQTFLQASKSGSGDKFKAKILHIYCKKSYIECYNFC